MHVPAPRPAPTPGRLEGTPGWLLSRSGHDVCVVWPVQVRFTCAADTKDNVILAVKEFPTCSYVFTVATPLLCAHPAFKPEVGHRGVHVCVG